MAKEKTYTEKLKDPRWQKKRLEIYNRDNFKCRACGDVDNTLHVHHRIYDDVEPWEADNNDLITLCKDCHKTWHYIYDSEMGEVAFLVIDLHDELERIDIQKYFNKQKANKIVKNNDWIRIIKKLVRFLFRKS